MLHPYSWFDWVIDAMPAVLFFLVGVAVVWFVWAAINESERETFELVKSEWNCTQTRSAPGASVLVGKVIVPTRHNECIEYRRN